MKPNSLRWEENYFWHLLGLSGNGTDLQITILFIKRKKHVFVFSNEIDYNVILKPLGYRSDKYSKKLSFGISGEGPIFV